jgi:hypothetical protein
MNRRIDITRAIAALLLIALPAIAFAQEAVVGGTIADTTGGVLPGVTVTAVHETTGNTFVGITDEKGAFRIPVRIGAYKVTAELAGFATATKTIELAVGQTGVLNLQMAPAAMQEALTVVGEAATSTRAR